MINPRRAVVAIALGASVLFTAGAAHATEVNPLVNRSADVEVNPLVNQAVDVEVNPLVGRCPGCG